MLVLTRKADQKIRIGSDVVVTVITVREGQVSIGIEAPKDIEIVREELLDRKKKTHEFSPQS